MECNGKGHIMSMGGVLSAKLCKSAERGGRWALLPDPSGKCSATTDFAGKGADDCATQRTCIEIVDQMLNQGHITALIKRRIPQSKGRDSEPAAVARFVDAMGYSYKYDGARNTKKIVGVPHSFAIKDA